MKFFRCCTNGIFTMRCVHERHGASKWSDNNEASCPILKIKAACCIAASLPVHPVKRCQRICEARCMRQTATCFMYTESFAPQQWLPFFCTFCLTLPRSPINTAPGIFPISSYSSAEKGTSLPAHLILLLFLFVSFRLAKSGVYSSKCVCKNEHEWAA